VESVGHVYHCRGPHEGRTKARGDPHQRTVGHHMLISAAANSHLAAISAERDEVCLAAKCRFRRGRYY
jgi:hypothetical protein